MSGLISQLMYIPETYIGVLLPEHLRIGPPRTEVEVEVAYQNVDGPVYVLLCWLQKYEIKISLSKISANCFAFLILQ